MMREILSELSQEAIVAALIDLRGTLHRAFFISLSLSLVVIFLIYEEDGGTAVAKVQSQFADAFDVQEATMAVSDSLIENPSSLRRYSEFMRPFLAISSSAEQAIVAVDVEDPDWLGLDPVARDLARLTNDTVMWLEHQVVFYQGDDLRSLHIENIKRFSEWLVFPEPRFDNESAIKILQAQQKVAKALGQQISLRGEWPESFYFLDFVRDAGFEQIAQSIDAVRAQFEMNDITLAVDRVDQLCIDNEINALDCTPNGLARIFDEEPNKLLADEKDKVSVDFFPIGVDRQLLIWLSPPLILATFFQFIGHETKRRRLIANLDSSTGSRSGIGILAAWALTDALRPYGLSLRDPFVSLQKAAMTVIVGTSVVLPSLALGTILIFGWRSDWHIAWHVGVTVSLVLSVVSLAGLVLPERLWVRSEEEI